MYTSANHDVLWADVPFTDCRFFKVLGQLDEYSEEHQGSADTKFALASDQILKISI